MRLVDLETAKTLQELGYDGEYAEIYNEYEISNVGTKWAKTPIEIPAPRLDDAAYWIREHYKILITIDYVWYDGYQYSISQNFAARRPNVVLSVSYDTYDSALEVAVTKAIEIIKNNL